MRLMPDEPSRRCKRRAIFRGSADAKRRRAFAAEQGGRDVCPTAGREAGATGVRTEAV